MRIRLRSFAMNNLTSETLSGSEQVPLIIRPTANRDDSELSGSDSVAGARDSIEPLIPEVIESVDEPNPLREKAASHGDTLLTSIAFLAVITVIQKSLGFFRSVFVCRILSPR